MYQVNGERHVDDWMAAQEDPLAREAMREWLTVVCDDPYKAAWVRRPRRGVPLMVAAVRGTCTLVTYMIVDQHHTVLIHRVDDVDLDQLLA